jgi:hypothetical protein
MHDEVGDSDLSVAADGVTEGFDGYETAIKTRPAENEAAQ